VVPFIARGVARRRKGCTIRTTGTRQKWLLTALLRRPIYRWEYLGDFRSNVARGSPPVRLRAGRFSTESRSV